MNLFQFHKGTIKTFSFMPKTDFNPHFNSIKVRLKLQERVRNYQERSHISIP